MSEPTTDLAVVPRWSPGGASGIGAACARELAARGAVVTVADIDDAGAKSAGAGDRRKGLGRRPFRCRAAGEAEARNRHPGEQRRHAEHRSDRRTSRPIASG